MLKIITLVVLLASLPFGTHGQEYPIRIMEEGHIVVQVALSDSIIGNFILDTGAGANVLSGKLFDKIASQAIKEGYFTGFRHDGDRLDGELYEIPYLAIGAVKEPKPLIGVYPPLDAMGIDGLLSLKFFENRPFSIDFKNRKITFINDHEARTLAKHSTTVPLELYQHTNVMLDVFIPITINGTAEILAEFDTGSGYDTYIVNTGYLNDLKLDPAEGSTQVYKTQLSGKERMDVIHTLNSVTVGAADEAIEIKDVVGIFREGLIHNALVGSGLFRDKTITIDIPNKVFIIHD